MPACEVSLWGRDADVLAEINGDGRNERSLPGVTPSQGGARDDRMRHRRSTARDSSPSRCPRSACARSCAELAPLIPADAVVVSLMKGIERGSHQRMSEVLGEAWVVDDARIAVVSGPNLAKEIARSSPPRPLSPPSRSRRAEVVAAATASGYFRPYTNTDVMGVELSGAYKNIIAVAVGIADGMGFGHNTTATVMTRGLAEITRLGLALDAKPDTFCGLAGMGDLIATCASPLSPQPHARRAHRPGRIPRRRHRDDGRHGGGRHDVAVDPGAREGARRRRSHLRCGRGDAARG